MTVEIWKSIKNWEGFYEVSSRGKVRSLDRVLYGGGTKYIKKGRLLKLHPCSNGYLSVSLYNLPKQECKLVHRLVAEAFIPNPDKKKEVNHKNGDKTDNRVDNLEWVSRSENLVHRNRVLGIHPAVYYQNKSCRCVETGKIYRSINECAREMGLWPSQISAHLSGEKGNGMVKGYHFEVIERLP